MGDYTVIEPSTLVANFTNQGESSIPTQLREFYGHAHPIHQILALHLLPALPLAMLLG